MWKNKMQEQKNTPNQELFYALLIDLGGVLTYLIPVLGELGDVIYAPLSAYLINKIFKSKAFAIGGFLEEALPGTDVIPTATLAWLKKRVGEGIIGSLLKGLFILLKLFSLGVVVYLVYQLVVYLLGGTPVEVIN